MIDVIARGMAANKGGGGGGDTYTKAEIDAFLAEKQDLITLLKKLSPELIDYDFSKVVTVDVNDDQTEVEVEGNSIKFLTPVSTNGDEIKIETDSTHLEGDEILL